MEKENKGANDAEGTVRDTVLAEAVRQARRFQATVFAEKVFQVSSAKLIEEAREEGGLRL